MELIPPFKHEIISYERRGRKFNRLVGGKSRAITYKPDFVGANWIIEVKGVKTPDFMIKWKLFKKLLQELNAPYVLFMPTNKKEVNFVIEEIKKLGNHGQDKELLQLATNQQLVVELDDSSEAGVDEA